MAISPLLRKLEVFGPLPGEDVRFLSDMLSGRRFVKANTVLIAENDVPDAVRLIVSGFACRLKRLAKGKRQISAYLLPGDFCDLHAFMLEKIDHTIQTLTDSIVVTISREQASDMTDRPAIAKSLLFATLLDEAILREWLTNQGQRNAVSRLAHLFCEIYFRMRIVGLVDGNSYDLPITQTELADSVGLSLVHTNKSLRVLANANLLTFNRGQLTILDLERLRACCDFQSNYLHLIGSRRGADTGAVFSLVASSEQA